ncbi:MAG: hypothetical protein HY078_16205 [Elusimicrobia bacterium]|nr:hypothetical protein [Elusimicrobiota bacterium]
MRRSLLTALLSAATGTVWCAGIDVPSAALPQIEEECGFGGDIIRHGEFFRSVFGTPEFANYLFMVRSCPKDSSKVVATVGKWADAGSGPTGGRFVLTWYEAGRARASFFKNRDADDAEIVLDLTSGRAEFRRYKGLP